MKITLQANILKYVNTILREYELRIKAKYNTKISEAKCVNLQTEFPTSQKIKKK